MKYLVLVAVAGLFLSGCSNLLDTSFYDDNESLLAVEVRYSVENLNCEYPNEKAKFKILKLKLYSESKGSKDIYKLADKMSKTAAGLSHDMNPTVCKIKKKLLQKQSKDVAYAIMRRY